MIDVSDVGTIRAALKFGRDLLRPFSDSPSSDVQVLLASIMHQSKAWILAHPAHSLPGELQEQFIESLNNICAGEPLPYVLGYWEFYGRKFKVTPDVLIPRPETERLIELAQDILDRQTHSGMAMDVGTGSGCIAITLAAERPGLRLLATDRSREALILAKENAALYSVAEQIDWLQSDLLGSVKARVMLVLANLPYIPSGRLKKLSVAAYEPMLALDGGAQGLDLIKSFIYQLTDRLAEGGAALLEIDESHGTDVAAFASEIFPRAGVTLIQDLAGLDRYLSIQLGKKV